MSLPSSSSLSSKKGVEGKHQTISLFPIANFLIHSNDTPAHDERRGASAGEKGDIDIYIYIYEYMCVCVCVPGIYISSSFSPHQVYTMEGLERTGKDREGKEMQERKDRERTGKGKERGVSLLHGIPHNTLVGFLPFTLPRK